MLNNSGMRTLIAVLLVLLAVGSLSACRGRVAGRTESQVVPPVVPEAPDLRTPERAVKSYTDWISYAYRVMNSEVATQAFTSYEEVRVNSYVQYNLLEQRGIEQSLQSSDYRLIRSTGTTVTLAGTEFWLYRYIASDQSRYLTGPIEASYDVTYTVVRQPEGSWLVDDVDVTRTNQPDQFEEPLEPKPKKKE